MACPKVRVISDKCKSYMQFSVLNSVHGTWNEPHRRVLEYNLLKCWFQTVINLTENRKQCLIITDRIYK